MPSAIINVMTRRALAAAVTTAAALAQSRATAQDAPKPDAAKPEPGLVEQARRQAAQSAETLAKFKMDIAVEPAFLFKA